VRRLRRPGHRLRRLERSASPIRGVGFADSRGRLRRLGRFGGASASEVCRVRGTFVALGTIDAARAAPAWSIESSGQLGEARGSSGCHGGRANRASAPMGDIATSVRGPLARLCPTRPRRQSIERVPRSGRLVQGSREAGGTPALRREAGGTPALRREAGGTPALRREAGGTPAHRREAGGTPALRPSARPDESARH